MIGWPFCFICDTGRASVGATTTGESQYSAGTIGDSSLPTQSTYSGVGKIKVYVHTPADHVMQMIKKDKRGSSVELEFVVCFIRR